MFSFNERMVRFWKSQSKHAEKTLRCQCPKDFSKKHVSDAAVEVYHLVQCHSMCVYFKFNEFIYKETEEPVVRLYSFLYVGSLLPLIVNFSAPKKLHEFYCEG